MSRFSPLLAVVLLASACTPVATAAPEAASAPLPYPTVTSPPAAAAAKVTAVTAETVTAETVTTELEKPDESEKPKAPAPENAPRGALVARVLGEIDVYAHRADPEPVMTLPATTILGTTTVLLVVDAPADGWARVLLPVRPNGSTGWISLKDVELSTVPGRIVIELGTRTLTYYENDEARVATRVGVGTERNPTPTGTFYVTDSVTLSDANSPWGPAALGLSARSETITEYNGGDGIIGIHGTNKPSSIGGAVSLGCIRLANDVIVQLHELVPLGTPVEIVP